VKTIAETAPDRTSAGLALPLWASPTVLFLSLAGLGVSTYLTFAHYVGAVTLACPDTGAINCEKVTTSPQSVIFGVPVAVLGLVFFTAMILLCLPRVWRNPDPLLRLTRLGAAVSGVGFAVYLIYTELFTVHAICLWCTSTHILAFLIFVAVLLAENLAGPLTRSDTDGACPQIRRRPSSDRLRVRLSPKL
jgi:uncharacterized membrane protein